MNGGQQEPQLPKKGAREIPARVDLSGLMHLGLDSDSASMAGGETDHSGPIQFTPPSLEELAEHFPDLEILECIGRGWPVGRRCRNRPFEPAARNWAARGQDPGEECQCYRKIEHNRLRHDVLHRLLFALHPDTILHSTVKRFIYL